MHTCYHPELAIGVAPLSEEEALHVVRVLRMKEGQTVRLIDGHGGLAHGVLMTVGKRSASVHVEQVEKEEVRPKGLVLVVAPTKANDRFEWLLEKATELGVEAVIPVWTDRSERRVDKHDRWRKVVVAATKQCQRRWMPQLHEACAMKDLFDLHSGLMERCGAVAHCMEEVSGLSDRVAWTEWQADCPEAWLAIGPEGDFTEAEVRWLAEHNADAVHLGALRLRTETAAMAAVAQFLSQGDTE